MSYVKQQLFKQSMMKSVKLNETAVSEAFWDQEETINMDNLI